jgi:enamine deaminase RidA (YjgF/YER057c/UK114 family)
MRLNIVPWLDRELVRVYGEGRPGLDVAEAVHDLTSRQAAAVAPHGLSLDDVVKTRLFARDKAGRDAGSNARREVFSGQARMVSSGLIAPAVLSSEGAIGLELIIVRPRQAGARKRLQEYDPPRTPLRYLVLDDLLFASGETWPGATLAEQVAATIASHGESLAHAGTSWERVVLISCFLQNRHSVAELRQALQQAVPIQGLPIECEHVEGYASKDALVEIEVTARVG